MADDKTFTSAILKRHEQLKRWEESDTNKCPGSEVGKDRKVKFQDGCIFLAACSSGDCNEVKRLLDRGADINTANIDGLTALHQACIDDNLDMVEFLVEHKADVDVCDNEGWTPLHATASCGFTEIARYLIRMHCNVAAVNNDGDLPYDICEADEMEKLLLQSMEEQGVDMEAARREEEDRMMTDANQWMAAKNKGETLEEDKHPKTGATALHVAAAKGYVKVIGVLLQAGAEINAKDVDGWTPLHAAAHWGMEESCKILAENMCDMEAKNNAGQTAFDVADTELVKLLEELKLKQASLKHQQKDLHIMTKVQSNRRSRNDPARSSVTRMSVEQKHNVMMKNVDQEKANLDGGHEPSLTEEKAKSSSSSCSEDEMTSDSETEKKNELNKKTSEKNQPTERDKPPIMTTVEIKEKHPPDMPKIEESTENSEKENLKNIDDKDELVKADKKKEDNLIGDGLIMKDKIFNNDTPESKKEEKANEKSNAKDVGKTEKIEDTLKQKDVNTVKENEVNDDVFMEKKEEKEKNKDTVNEKDKNKAETPLIENVTPRKGREALKRTESAPPGVTEVPKISINSKSYVKDEGKGENDIPSWRRLGLRKTGSTSMVPQETTISRISEEDKSLIRSASSPRLAEEDEENKKNEKNDKPLTRRPFLSSSSFSGTDHNNSSLTDRYGGSGVKQNPYIAGLSSSMNSSGTGRSGYQSSYVPYYRMKDRERQEKELADKENKANIRNSSPASLALSSANTTISSTSSATTITTPTSSFTHHRKSYEAPKRDEETEMLRKVRAKRARETRRSTQGVTLEDVQQANQVLQKPDVDPASTLSTAMTISTATSLADRNRSDGATTKSQVTTDSSLGTKDSVSSVLNDKDISSRLTGDVNLRRTQSALDSDSSALSSWRRSREEAAAKNDDDSAPRSSSFRRMREGRDLTDSSAYVPRNRTDRTERNALSAADIGSNSILSASLGRTASLRADRLKKAEEDSQLELRRDKDKEKESDKSKDDKEEKRPESTAIRRRRINKERRSTGIANYTPEDLKQMRENAAQWKQDNEDEDKDKENKDDTKGEQPDTDDKSSRYPRYSSTSDVPSNLTTRPSSYSEYSHTRSTPSLEKDYKKLYEDEKTEKERLKRELEQCKKELREAKVELEKQMNKHEANRVSDTNDKRERRALERKLSELEEEIKKMDQLKEDNRRLREENGALIRVISKLSK
ncbi:protein phosphatase 1 regulatory subunit 12A-like isoform X4 [Mya arenaria]|uniref:protein phosphatase 1 regulatory subunit 12A-like isoform X4 n=1 Tax=Mya arenaria TaxID=6604 RepID=UPI0022E257D9|nr:protein phosphatase 1 regulatory subunit 12A-like isoform X4 [Mya arenaria]